MAAGRAAYAATPFAKNVPVSHRETPETAVGEDRRDSETAVVDQCWAVVAGMGQWWSEVDAGVEQGH
jgi:hypothetical protein